MKVLIADFDLFAAIGGGQTFYRANILRNPAIEFFYLTVRESPAAVRPANAHPIIYRELYPPPRREKQFVADSRHWSLLACSKANNIASSVAGLQFDVVDLPDYEQFGSFLRPALEWHGVRVGRLALSMHGTLSNSIASNWSCEGTDFGECELLERSQFLTADLRYGLSRKYLDEWRQRSDLPAYYLNPLWFVDWPEATRTRPSPDPPSLQFVGRTEKCKGPDLFVELAWWLPRGSYSSATIIGPPSIDFHGNSSNAHLTAMAARRLGPGQLRLSPAFTTDGLKALFASRSMTVLPSRYDTFLLVALESLLSGCPTAIGTGAGVCQFLKETLPDVPFVQVDIDDPYGSLPALKHALEHYDLYRDRLVNALPVSRPMPHGLSLSDIYMRSSEFDATARREADEWYAKRMRGNAPRPSKVRAFARRTARGWVSPEMCRQLRTIATRQTLGRLEQSVRRRAEQSPFFDRLVQLRASVRASEVTRGYRKLRELPEQNDADLAAKLHICHELVARTRVDRVRLWREIARLESLRGNDLLSATFRLRAIRLAGADRWADLSVTLGTLRRHGHEREADAVDAMYGGHCDVDARCERLLADVFLSPRFRNPHAFEFVDDRREIRTCKASIIVSLYSAADKLPTFLRALRTQTLFDGGKAELVLIDSGSPTGEYSVFRRLASELKTRVVYARSPQRETIQAAWNRGIGLARGEYVCFLGVDEGLLPHALETLAHELDTDRSLDWVQANSLVARVDGHGQWLCDELEYDRGDFRPWVPYLETCYLSSVAALYRRTLHQQFGLYDPSFRCAGDTEFKCRVLPFIKAKVLRQTWGVLWNYPDERMTSSPTAEIEDLRAWHLFRTRAGIRRAFAHRDPKDLEELLFLALRYRKSYFRHWSTDIELAGHVARELEARCPGSLAGRFREGLGKLLNAYRNLDELPHCGSLALRAAILRTTRLAGNIAARQRRLSDGRVTPAFGVFNDNRYEQHHHAWRLAASWPARSARALGHLA